ncbi:MAG: Hsp70 family protein [Myxococcaceae bacterium]
MHIVGIDLGTTHCALASVDPALGANAPITDFPVPQLVRPGELAPRTLLPSCVYLPGDHELAAGALSLPWDPNRNFAVGELARWQGARVPGRLVASAKSWLCHPGVDRQAAILPWGAPPEVAKISPVDASAKLLAHLAETWNAAHPAAPLADQEVVITVPASFDEAARALTVSAARSVGLQKLTLLEEPQAALYDFTARHRSNRTRPLEGIRLVLVVDVGGGTTDFTLVWVEALPEGPALKRLAVGDHLMLGGDNMDAAVAKRLEEKWEGRRLSAAQWTQLVQAARTAKEALLSSQPPEKHGVSLVTEGSKLLGGSLSAELSREEVETLVVEGFFPASDTPESPRRSGRMALVQLGLPYASDPAITRHLAGFLRAHARSGFTALGVENPAADALPRPDAILLNGGVFNSPRLTQRLVDVVSRWWPQSPRICLLEHHALDRAVARGAAYYGLTRRGLGRRISGGAARAYYVGLEGLEGSNQVVCLIPRGFEEGEAVELKDRSFTLTLGRPVQFQLYSTTADRIDKPGDVGARDEDFVALPPIHTLLRSADSKREAIPVHLKTGLTEIGTLELFCVADTGDERWRLEFGLRGAHGNDRIAVTESMPASFSAAVEQVQRAFGSKPLPVGPKDVKQLSRNLEKALGPRETWRVPMLRELWTALFAGVSKRRRSSDHERVSFALLGYSLRPGFGYPLDEWRCSETFRLFKEGVQAHQEKPVWIEFWVMWRRIAGGLSEDAQRELWAYLSPQLERRLNPDVVHKTKLKGVQPEGLDEMVRAAASLEHLEPTEKEVLGTWIAQRLRESAGGPWTWCLGRLGARVPLYGSSHRTLAPEVVSPWLELLLDLGLGKIDGAPFAAAQLARLTGDRTRDLEPELRERTLAALAAVKAPDGWLQLVREVTVLSAADEARALGDTLPVGLSLG